MSSILEHANERCEKNKRGEKQVPEKNSFAVIISDE
jgi:hypothetical protein